MINTEQIGTSEAETKLLIELQKRGLNKGLMYQYAIALDEKKYGVKFTVVDFYYPYLGLAIYLDGEPHEKLAHSEKDNLIDKALEDIGIRVLRFSHETPITISRVKEIVDAIEKEVKKDGLYFLFP